ncbi:hypothetical protein HMPREF2983_04395 [Prevotella sp. HMSC077E09]|uniref:hypothetical protein n=1 Tax=Prevotella sp. HMSC077E09 TaxID=1739487 RepID=UPI0008A5D0BA|nr:hypothetical protein [Prevotella sp. HMSC077E09]OFP60653.1 hypothetical protein HMPREF2983_04395 [Prevotella sp. HMSC077E09]
MRSLKPNQLIKRLNLWIVIKLSPDGIKTAFDHWFNPIGTYIFKGLDRENGILDLSMFTNLTSVDCNAFRWIDHLYKLVLPPTLSTYDTCFYTSTIDNIIIEVIEKQNSLLWGLTFKNLIIKSVNPPITERRASYGWYARKESRIFVPDESVENYRKSDSFSDIAEYIHPMSEYQP